MKNLENNKLIAEFMGLLKDKNGYYKKDGEILYVLSELDYSSSWDWLMPVVEEIETLSYNKGEVLITVNHQNYSICEIKTPFKTFGLLGTKKIQVVYETVIEFIKWYNLNK